MTTAADIDKAFTSALKAAKLVAICGEQQFKEARRALLQVILPGQDLTDEALLPADQRFNAEWVDQVAPHETWTEEEAHALAYRIYSDTRQHRDARIGVLFLDRAFVALGKHGDAQKTNTQD